MGWTELGLTAKVHVKRRSDLCSVAYFEREIEEAQ